MIALDDYLVDPKLSLLDKTRIQAQVLVPVLRALRSELGKEKADAIVKQALRRWSEQLFAAIADGVDGSPRRKWAAMHTAMAEIIKHDVTVEMRRHDKEALECDITHCRFAEFFRARRARAWRAARMRSRLRHRRCGRRRRHLHS